MKTFKRETVGGEEVDKKLGNIGGRMLEWGKSQLITVSVAWSHKDEMLFNRKISHAPSPRPVGTARFETSRGEVCRESGTIYQYRTPEDPSPSRVAHASSLMPHSFHWTKKRPCCSAFNKGLLARWLKGDSEIDYSSLIPWPLIPSCLPYRHRWVQDKETQLRETKSLP